MSKGAAESLAVRFQRDEDYYKDKCNAFSVHNRSCFNLVELTSAVTQAISMYTFWLLGIIYRQFPS